MKIIIRADASLHIGSGHIMRTLVLANILKEQGHNVSYASRPQQGDLIQFTKNKGFKVYKLITHAQYFPPKNSNDYKAWLQVTWQEDAQSIILSIDSVDLIIVDHYGINADWEIFIKNHFSCKIFAIDDLVRKHQAEMILDQTLLRTKNEYKDLNPNSIALTGGHFVLLNPSFLNYRYSTRLKQLCPPKVLVSMGGIDQPNATLEVLKALSLIIQNKPHVTVLLSPKAPHYESVINFCTQHSDWLSHINFVDNMAKLIVEHHFSVGAPGTTSWERAYLGIPSIIIPLADNQRRTSKQLVKVGAAIKLEIDEIAQDFSKSYQTMINNKESMYLASLSLCDGLGGFRVAENINNIGLKNADAIILKPAMTSDIKQVYDWQQLPSTRKFALQKKNPSWKEHQQWMKNKLSDQKNFFYIIESLKNKKNVGAVRLDKNEDNAYTISIFIDANYFRQGYAKKSLNYINRLHPNITIQATVLEKNIASQHLFLDANYEQIRPNKFVRHSLIREIK